MIEERRKDNLACLKGCELRLRKVPILEWVNINQVTIIEENVNVKSSNLCIHVLQKCGT